MAIASIGTNKSLSYQLIPLITKVIVLVALLIVAFMEDQLCFMLLFYIIVMIN